MVDDEQVNILTLPFLRVLEKIGIARVFAFPWWFSTN
jgi:hypothetical protein